MKNIVLSHGYFLEIDGNIITLKKESPSRNTKPGETPRIVTKTEGYYTTFGGALLAFRKKLIKGVLSHQEAITLKEAIVLVQKLDVETRQMIIDTGLDCGATNLI